LWSIRKSLRRLLFIVDRFLIEKSERAPLAETAIQPGAIIREPRWNYEILYEIGKTNWVLRMVVRAITQEALGPRWKIEAKFVRKCEKCGAEYDKEIAVCEVAGCEGATRKPSEAQYQKLEKLLEKPNRDYGWEDLLRSAIFYDQILDDWYVSVTFTKMEMVNPQTGETLRKTVANEVYIEDSRYMRMVADEKGHLGNNEWFCPTCYTPDVFKATDPAATDVPICDKCGEEMKRTAYVFQHQGAIKARWSTEEIIHSSSSKVLPELYGMPKPVALWKLLNTMGAMDDYGYEVYSEGKVGSVVLFPGMSQDEVDSLGTRVEAAQETKDKVDITTGIRTTRKKIRTLFLGAKETPEVIKIMEDLEKLQSLEYYKHYRDAVCAVYGVTPVFVSVIESGRAGNNPRMQIDVQNRTTREVQANKEDVLNNQLLLKFEIYDWSFRFNEIEAEDDLRMKEIERLRAETARIYLECGFQVGFDEFGELKVTGQGQMPGQISDIEKLRRQLKKLENLATSIQKETLEPLQDLESQVKLHETRIQEIMKARRSPRTHAR